MADEASLKQRIRHALSQDYSVCIPALRSLANSDTNLPPAAVPHLLSRISTSSPSAVSLLITIVRESINNGAEAQINKKFNALSSNLRKTPGDGREALRLCKFACAFVEFEQTKASAVELLITSIAALEALTVPDGGPQKRSKRKAIRVAYRYSTSVISANISSTKDALFKATERYAKARYEAVVALGLLAHSYPAFDSFEQEKYLTTTAIVCLKAVNIAEDVVRVSAPGISLAAQNVVTEKVLPIIDHALKRETQQVLPAAVLLLEALQSIDMSHGAVKTLIPTFHQATTSSDERIRLHAVKLANAIGKCVKNESILLSIAIDLIEGLKSARYAYQKSNMVQSLAGLVCASNLSNAVYDNVLQELLSWLASKKETNVEVRLAGFEALLNILQHIPENMMRSGGTSEALVLIANALQGKLTDSDRRAVLTAMTNDLPKSCLSKFLVPKGCREALESIAAAGSTKSKQGDALRSLAILSTWNMDEDGKANNLGPQVKKSLPTSHIFPALQDPATFSSLHETVCALTCCVWIVQTKHEAIDLAIETLYKHSLDRRSEVSDRAVRQIQLFHKRGELPLRTRMLKVLWNTQLRCPEGGKEVARSYNFDDSMRSAERLGHSLLATVLPSIPMDSIPIIALASNHPRIHTTPADYRPRRPSRFWRAISRRLGEVDSNYSSDSTDDWLGRCLECIFGLEGLQSDNHALIRAAVNSVCGLADPGNAYSTRVLRYTMANLKKFFIDASSLDDAHFEALRFVREAESSDPENAENTIQKKTSKKQAIDSRKHSTQAKQAQIDKRRAAAASASAMSDKLKTARVQAKETRKSLNLAQNALLVVSELTSVAPNGMHDLMSFALGLVLPLAKIRELEEPCRRAIAALMRIIGQEIRGISSEISSCLYGLQRGNEVHALVSQIIFFVQEMVPSALASEDFSAIMFIVRAALLRDPNFGNIGRISGRRGSTKRRDGIAVVKAAAQVLLEHCKPEALDAAVAAAASRAGSWIIQVLEREDGSFTASADALALLTGTALSPGTEALGQVFDGIVSGKSSVRDAVLTALSRLVPLFSSTIGCPRDSPLGRMLWLACFDPDEANAELAIELWTNYGHPLYVQEDIPALLELITNKEVDVRTMAAKAIAKAVRGKENELIRSRCLPIVFDMYTKSLSHRNQEGSGEPNGSVKKGISAPIKRGRDRSDQKEIHDENWMAREGVAVLLENMASSNSLTIKDATIAFSFLASRGLGDENKTVREHMSRAAISIVEAAGGHSPTILLPMIEKQLNTKMSSGATQDEIMHADQTREHLVMCLGSVAGFLPADDERVENIAMQVIKSAVETPSEVVQNAAARCLAPLAKAAIATDRERTLNELIKAVWSEDVSYGERRGAAYALAGIAKGMGLKYVKRSKLLNEIEKAVKDKLPRRRQGGFMLIETHAILLGRLFEPYVVSIVPFLLSCMGDTSVEVRNACWAAAQASMAEISSQGVKMILPSLLAGLQERQWRTKAGSAEVLGAMAFCAPRQLAQCLPQVVPKLAEALADAHPKVVDSAESAVNRIAAVVRSPEVRKLSPFLLAALRDPAGRTRGAIDAMLGSEFVNAIDAASLALLIPPLHRGLRDRNSELKKRSAAIVGSMCNNVANHADVIPYLDLLLPSLQVTLLDAIPGVRRTSARALGALAVSLGEHGLGDIVLWLINALLGGKNNTDVVDKTRTVAAVISSSAERSGAAMGLAEISASMNDRRLEEVLGTILGAGGSSAQAREGGLMFIAFLPRALGDRFEEKLGQSLSAILKGLSDDADSVREAALLAGRNLVSAYAKSSLDRILPELLSAMRENLWRIRQAATQLLGDMLLVIAGAILGKTDEYGLGPSENGIANGDGEDRLEEDDGEEEDGVDDEEFESPEQAAAAMTTEATMRAIEDVLGFERRNEVLAALYIIRCDVSVRVRQTGMQVWKSVVANTPRVLREIMPSAVKQIVDGLGDEDEERRAASGKTLNDLSQKLGDRVVPEVLPALRMGICNKNASSRIRRGACEGLSELVSACPKNQLEEHAKDLIDAVHHALFDDLPSVRIIAAEVFASLLRPLGKTVVDAIVPKLIELLPSELPEAEIALDSLKQILTTCGSRLTSIVVPPLISKTPLQTASCRALATAAAVAQSGFEPYVSDAVDAVVDTLEAVVVEQASEPVEDLLASIANSGEEARKLMLHSLFSKFNEGYPERRVATSQAIAGFCRRSSLEVVNASSLSLLEVVVRQLADTDEDAAKSAWNALKVLSDVIPRGNLSTHIPTIRQSLRSASTGITVMYTTTTITALQIPKGVAPFVPIFTDGLLNGSPELREQAALGIAELVEFSSTQSSGPFVIKLAGPLIRVFSGRFPWQVKAAILKALIGLLKKNGVMLRSFAPQLQSIFTKSLSDNSRLVRVRACAALGALVGVQTRLEPLLNELVNLCLNGDTSYAQTASLHSLSQVFKLGKKVPESSFTKVAESIVQVFGEDDSEVREAASRCIGVLATRSSNELQYCQLLNIVHNRFEMEGTEYTDRICSIRAMGAIFKAGKKVEELSWEAIKCYVEEVYGVFESGIAPLRAAGCSSLGGLFMLFHKSENMLATHAREAKRRCLLRLSESAEFDEQPDVRIAALHALKSVIAEDNVVIEICAESMVACAGASNTGIRDVADRVLRKAVIIGENLSVSNKRLELLKSFLNEEDKKLVDRRIPKLRALAVSDDERS